MKSPLRPVVVIVGGVLLLAACQSSASGSPSGNGLSGDIQISGSSTVEPITSLVAEAFGAIHPNVTYFVDGPGTGDGFALFCNDEIDISDASRPISDEEIAACETTGVEYIELKIAIDGLSVITSAFNDEISCLSFLDLYALLGPESQGFETWDAANDLADELESQLGTERGASHAPYGPFPLDVTAPGEESGTFDSFVELAIRGIADEREQDRTTRPDYTPSGDDNVIIEGVAGTQDAPDTLGWVGFAFADENADRVKLLEVDQGDGCVAATPETIASAEYPLSRFLYIYVNSGRAAENPALEGFVDYYLSDEGIGFVIEADYIALDPADLDETRATWNGR
ncbi:MAG: substrate-binding domain-containing protein [Candidatus Limnocylindria bacterium]